MPTKSKMIEIEISCPECGSVFQDGFKETELMNDPDIPLTFECPDCDCEFERGYTYAAGTVTLSEESTVTEHGDQWTGDSDIDGDEDDDEEDE